MTPRITRQSEYYGLPDQDAHHEREASLPTEAEVADLLRGPRIQAGLLRTDSAE